MAIKDWNAGIIRPVPVAPAGPYQDGAAPGVWTLDQVAYWQKQGLWPTAGNNKPIGVFATVDGQSSINYITISTTGNALDFGDLTVFSSAETNIFGLAACASSTRGVYAGGRTYNGSEFVASSIMQYITIASTGNSTTFGNLTVGSQYLAGCNSATRGIFAGGSTAGSSQYNSIGYITIATTGNASSFGQLTQARDYLASCSSPTRGIFAGGSASGVTFSNVIDYITIASTGNATDFGDLYHKAYGLSGASNSTRGLFASGYSDYAQTNVIQYITIASTGNSTDFGDLTQTGRLNAACSSSTRFVTTSGYNTNVLEYVTIDTTGNATDFGDLLGGQPVAMGGCSNANGGVQ